ncbi:MAG: RsmD family RNA methyltransferase [Roseivirga sp.]
MLKANKYPNWPMKEIVTQIQSKQKAKKKLPTWFSTSRIIFPPLLSMEQCSSELTAAYKAGLAEKGKRMVDLTGGFGVDISAFANLFSECHYVERNEGLSAIAQHNFESLGFQNLHVHTDDSIRFLKENRAFDLIYIDPARRGDRDQKVVSLNDCEPNVIDLLPDLLVKSKRVIIKTSPLLDIKGAIRELQHVAAVHVVAVGNEVKELLFELNASAEGDPIIHCVNLTKGKTEQFDFQFSEEEELLSTFGAMRKYLYEPNASILKGGGFKVIGERLKLRKLHPNSHLYTADVLVDDFPGRSFEVLDEISLNKKSLRKIIPTMKANITVRNYPMSVAQIRKKTGLKEGGEDYLFATSDQMGAKVFQTRKVT